MRKHLLVLLVFALFGVATVAVTQETTVKNLGLEIKYPSSLTLERGVSSDKAMTLTNFEGKWLHGGVIPADGMEITIVRHEKESWTLEQMINEEGKGSRLVSRQTYRIDGQNGVRIVWEDDYQTFKMTQTRVYVDRGTLVYKFNLSWDENSRNQKSF